jgi:hypothetical protein
MGVDRMVEKEGGGGGVACVIFGDLWVSLGEGNRGQEGGGAWIAQ